MGFPWQKKQQQAAPQEQAERRPSEAADGPSTTVKSDSARASSKDGAAAPVTDADVPLPAVFDFGGPAVQSGVQMKGICAVDDPDQIQACLWRVDPVPASTPETEPKYQILF